MENGMLQEYKIQIKKISKEIEKIDIEINSLNPNDSNNNLKLNELKNIHNDLNYFLRNLNFSAKWLELGHEPGIYNGIENRFRAGEGY